jgi:uncharacterized protein (DUF924 family)
MTNVVPVDVNVQAHLEPVQKFGRLSERNKMLGRESR